MSVYSVFVLNNCALLDLLMFVSIYSCQLMQELYSQNWSVLFLVYNWPPELLEIPWPKLGRTWRAEGLKTPNVSIAMGWKTWRVSTSIYFSSLREAAISAVEPACRAAPSIYGAANRHVTVTSQHSDLPLCQGMSVRPSGLFPVCSK